MLCAPRPRPRARLSLSLAVSPSLRPQRSGRESTAAAARRAARTYSITVEWNHMFCSSPARYQHASSVVLSRCRAACTPARTWQGRCRVAACATFTQARLARRPYCLPRERARGREREREREREEKEKRKRERERERERERKREREKARVPTPPRLPPNTSSTCSLVRRITHVHGCGRCVAEEAGGVRERACVRGSARAPVPPNGKGARIARLPKIT